MPKTTTAKKYSANEVLDILEKALAIPEGGYIEVRIKMVDAEGDWHAALPLKPRFDGVVVHGEVPE